MKIRLDTTLARLDTAHLAQYTLGDPELEREVLQMFMDQASIYTDQLAVVTDQTVWNEITHSLKGSARGVGAFRIGAISEQLEKNTVPFEQLDRQQLVAYLRAEVEQTGVAVAEYLDGRG